MNSPHFRGYSRVGTERTAGAADQRDQLDIGPERPPSTRCRRTSRTWRWSAPTSGPPPAPSLRAGRADWLGEANRVSREVLRALAAALGQPETYFDEWFDDEAHLHVKVVRYPGASRSSPTRASAPTRTTAYLAFLLQDDLGGCRSRRRTAPGSTPPRPGAPSCSTSASCSRSPPAATCAPPGTVSSARRRAATASACRSSSGRAWTPSCSRLQLPPELAAGGGRRGHDPDEPDPARVRLEELRGWLRSHPRVAERWWPDLTAQRAERSRRPVRAGRSPSSRRGCGAAPPPGSRRPGSRGSPR